MLSKCKKFKQIRDHNRVTCKIRSIEEELNIEGHEPFSNGLTGFEMFAFAIV